MKLEVDVSLQLGTFTLEVRFATDHGLTALFGPSGSGKTSLVNIIGGLLRPDRGYVVVDGRVLVDTEKHVFVPKHRRRLGYIFQEPRLFPHLTVRQNLTYGRWFTPSSERQENVDHVVDILGIGALLDRGPSLLSGGEKQRVAIGRALLASPQMFLMDEPLAALDEARKLEILPYIERLRDESKIPIVYVSHSISEVARLANSLVLLSDGKITAVGSVSDIMSRGELFPTSAIAEVGAVLEMRVMSHDEKYDLTVLQSRAGEIRVPRQDAAIGSVVHVRVRASDVVLALNRPVGLSALNVLSGQITDIGPHYGSMTDIRINLSGDTLLARVTQFTVDRMGLSLGQSVFSIIKTVAIDHQSLGRFQSVPGL